MKNTYFRFAASFFLLLAIGLEINHSFIQQVPWKGLELAANFVSFPMLAFWGLALASLWASKTTLKPWLVFGIFFLFMHGVVLATAGNGLGAVYSLSGLLAGICSAFAHLGESARIRERPRTGLKLAS